MEELVNSLTLIEGWLNQKQRRPALKAAMVGMKPENLTVYH